MFFILSLLGKIPFYCSFLFIQYSRSFEKQNIYAKLYIYLINRSEAVARRCSVKKVVLRAPFLPNTFGGFL